MTRQIVIPENIKNILIALQNNGFKAYITGGAVRDALLLRTPTDYDIITNATVSQLKNIAWQNNWQTTDEFGEQYGVTTLLLNDDKIQVTTFRQEVYKNHPHKPDSISFTDDLTLDLNRRDFTLNALVLDLKGNIYDQFGGLNDLKKKKLKVIGTPQKRFDEDALRMYRACRFCSYLGFIPDKQLYKALLLNYPKAQRLSVDLIKKELEKLLVSQRPSIGLRMIAKSTILHGLFIQLTTINKKDLKQLDNKNLAIEDIWARLLLLTKSQAHTILTQFNYSKKFIDKVQHAMTKNKS